MEPTLTIMEPTLEQAFVIELELLISYYISKGIAPGLLEERLLQATEGLFESLSEEDEV